VVRGLAAARQVRDQDTVVDEDGVRQIRQGVARDRRISIEDPQMRHGRKTKRVRIDGYKRHVLCDLDTDLVPAVGVTAANVAEAEVAEQSTADLDAQHRTLGEFHIDRAYLSSSLVAGRDPDLQVFCKAFPVRNGPRFAKPAFQLDFDRGLLTCPNGVTVAFTLGGRVQFPAEVCAACPLRAQCTTSARGRSVQIHLTSGCLSSCGPRSRPRRGGPGSASASRSSTPWPMSAAGKATAPATSASARTCSTCAGSRSSITCTSSPANPYRPSKLREADT
jgi:transposase